MREFYEVEKIIHGEKVMVKRYGDSDGDGYNELYNAKTGERKKNVKRKAVPADSALHNMELLLESAIKHGDPQETIDTISNAIASRKRELGMKVVK
jgi:hypothetical protein